MPTTLVRPSPPSVDAGSPTRGGWRRIVPVLAALCIAASLFFPLWGMTMVAPQYPEGLNLLVYANRFEGGASEYVDQLAEINTLNHYIGMAELHAANFPELKVLPIGIGLAALLALLGVTGRRRWPIASLAVLGVIGLGGLASAYYRLYQYGHNLDPLAPVKVEPFTPVFLGSNQIANFTTTGAFQTGSYFLLAGAVLLLVALYPFRRSRTPKGIRVSRW